MKRVFIFASLVLMLASCSIHKASVSTTSVYSPAIETATMASLQVSKEKISYEYYPEYKDARTLSLDQLVKNAIYQALQKNGNADELIGVNYYISLRRGFFGKQVQSIKVAGYPAYYKDFREPDEMDLESVETLSRSTMFRQSELKSFKVGADE